MQIDKVTFSSIVSVFRDYDAAAHDEVEAVYSGENLDRESIQRLLQYLRSTSARRQQGSDSFVTTTLDVGVTLPERLGPVRVTISGSDDALRKALSTKVLTNPVWSSSTVMHKRRMRPSVDVHEQRFRVNLKREEPITEAVELHAARTLAANDTGAAKKVYRLKRRFSFPASDAKFRYDVTAVRQLSHAAPTWEMLIAVPERFEVECELVQADIAPTIPRPMKDKKVDDKEIEKAATLNAIAMLKCFSVILKVLDDTDRLLTITQRDQVLTEFLSLMYPADKAAWGPQVIAGSVQPRFLPGPKPVTLEARHLQEGGSRHPHKQGKIKSTSSSPSCDDEISNDSSSSISPVAGVPYTVTDKADGVHRILFVASDGKAYMLAVEGVVKVRATSLFCKGGSGRGNSSVLDGEFITGVGLNGSLFAAFDAYFFEGADIRRLILMPEKEEGKRRSGAAGPGAGADDIETGLSPKSIKRPGPTSRLAACEMVASSLASSSSSSSTQASTSLKVIVKRFLWYDGSIEGMTASVQKIVARRDAHNFPYQVDGLILTPALWPVGALGLEGAVKSEQTWEAALKWKPPEQNSIDFLVRIIPGQLVRRKNASYRVAHLYVGYDPAKWDPITTLALLTDRATPAARRASGVYVERLFGVPGETIKDAGLHICHLRVEEGDDRMHCKSGEEVMDSTIVEFTYDTEADADVPHSFRWIPLRPRPDKTQRYVSSGGEIGGAANDIRSALSVWTSILNPVTEAVMCGKKAATPGKKGTGTGAGESPVAYYVGKMGTGGMAAMRAFHGWVKSTDLLLRLKGPTTRSLFDIGCGQGGDLHTWRKLDVSRVLGIDLYGAGITDPMTGANMRIMEERKRNGRRGEVQAPLPRIVLLPIDASKPIDRLQIEALDEGSGDRLVARVVWSLVESSSIKDDRLRRYHGFAGRGGFDVVSCQFAVHYFFSTPATLRAFASNVAMHLRRGGFFVGTCMDGHRVATALGERTCMQGLAGGKVIWRIQRLYELDQFDPTAPCQKNTGLQIKVYVQTIGQTVLEYLVDYRLLRQAMAEVGLVPPNADQLAQLGLTEAEAPGGTSTFESSFARMQEMREGDQDRHAKTALAMTDDERAFSFLNRWFIFVKSDEVVVLTPHPQDF